MTMEKEVSELVAQILRFVFFIERNIFTGNFLFSLSVALLEKVNGRTGRKCVINNGTHIEYN